MEAFVYDPWNPYATTANDAVLDFENGTLAKRWLHGPRTDEPLGFEGYTGSTDAGSGSAYGLYANRLGSILAAVSISTGAVAADYDYDAFGNQTQTVNTIEQRYGYTGREHDTETGLVYYRARHYDPATGQFIQRDPIGFAAGDLNLYAYVENDPYNWTDPTGLTPTTSYVRKAANAVKTATLVGGSIGRGVFSLANAISRALECVSAGAHAIAGNYGDAASSGLGCVSGGKAAKTSQPRNSKGQFTKGAGGESADTARGREAHKAFQDKVAAKQKDGWDPKPRIQDADGRVHIPDALTPSGRPIELKPNTPSGIKAGRRQLKRYEQVTGKKGRLILYD